jgi:deoxycytidylate deaminase
MKILKDKEKEQTAIFIKEAVMASKNSRCLKRPRGVVIVLDGQIIGRGWNAPADEHTCKECLRDKMKPKIFATFNTEPCYSVHAEQRAIINAFKNGCSDLSNAKMYFARADQSGKYLPCDDGPSCTICSKLILESGIKSFIYEDTDNGIVELSAKEFNNFSIKYVEDTK